MAFNRQFQDVSPNSSRSSRFESYGRNNSGNTTAGSGTTTGRPSTNLQDRLLGSHMDAKDRITSTLKSLGIYKGETTGSSFNFENPSRSGKEGRNSSLDLPLWDISSLKQSKSGRSTTRWNAAEDSIHGSQGSSQQSSPFSFPNQGNTSVNPGANQPSQQPQSGHVTNYSQSGNQYSTDYSSSGFNTSQGQNQALSNYSSQSQQQGFGSSHEIPYNGPAQLPPYGHSMEVASQRSSSENKGIWEPTPSYTPQSQAHGSLSSGSNAQSWPVQENPTAQPTFSQSVAQNLGNQQTIFPITTRSFGNSGSDPTKFKSAGGLFDIAKKTSYSKSTRPNLKPLVEVTISNPAALNTNQSQEVNRDPRVKTVGKNVASAENAKSGNKRKPDPLESPISSKRPTNKKTPEQIAVLNWRKEKVILPGKEAGIRFKDDAEKLQLVGKISQGSQGHQMELFKLVGLKESFTRKFLIPWKCYLCDGNCRSWLDYVNHCTGKFHRNTVHSFGTDKGNEERKKLTELLRSLPLIPDALCKSIVSAEGTVYQEETEREIPREKQDGESTIHACKACGKFYLKVDGLIRHKETEEHKERVEFLEERFGESWQQFQWYNQASQSSGRNAEEPVGVAFIVPISGFFCKLCSQFYNSEVKAKDVHCRQKNHIQKVKEWDRTSKGSMASLPVDPVEIAEAVRQNDKASSPAVTKESSKQRSRSRSSSMSRQNTKASSSSKDKKQDTSSLRKSTTRPDKKVGESHSAKHSSSSSIKIPGLDLGISADDVVEVSDYSDVSEDENFLSDRSGKNGTPKKKTSKEKEKSVIGDKQKRNTEGDASSSLEEKELSVSSVRQQEKDQKKEEIDKDKELRERARQWKEAVMREEAERKEQRKKERESRRQRDYHGPGLKDIDRKEKERREKELKEQLEKEWLEKEKKEKEALEKERREKEQLQKEKEMLEKEKEQLQKEREEKERQEKERLEKEKLEQEQRESLAKALQEKEKLEQEQREKERQEKEKLERERLEKEAREKQRLEDEKKEKERKEQERREKIRMQQERQIREEKRRLEHAKVQLERARRLQEQREKEFKENQMREKGLMEKRMWEQQMREKELMEQQLRQQQMIEQQQLELEREGKRLSAKERREMERRERELEEQHLRERELKERELQEQQEREFRKLQETQQKEQESRHREMIEREQKETEMREEEQKQIEEQWRNLRERELRAEELHQANLQEQEIRDRQIREQGFIEWQRREQAMREDGVPEREILIRRDMFDRELQEMAMRDAEIRAQQLGEVLHDPQGEVDLREKVIQQQQMREQRERVLLELREEAQQALERKEIDMRRKGYPIAEIEDVIIAERRVMEEQIVEELRLRGLAGPEFENEERRIQETEEDVLAARERHRDGSRGREDRERSRERERDLREDDYRLRRSRERDEGDEREIQGEVFRRDEEDARQRIRARERHEKTIEEEEMLRRQRHEEPGSSMGDLVVHERGGFRDVQIVDKAVDPVEFSRERERRSSREKGGPWEGEDRERSTGGGRDMRVTRGRRGRPFYNRGRGRGRRGRLR